MSTIQSTKRGCNGQVTNRREFLQKMATGLTALAIPVTAMALPAPLDGKLRQFHALGLRLRVRYGLTHVPNAADYQRIARGYRELTLIHRPEMGEAVVAHPDHCSTVACLPRLNDTRRLCWALAQHVAHVRGERYSWPEQRSIAAVFGLGLCGMEWEG